MLLYPLHKILKPQIFVARKFNSWTIALKHASSPTMALTLFAKMHRKGLAFDNFPILFALNHCTRLRNRSLVPHLHAHLLKLGLRDAYVDTALLRGYALLDEGDAWRVFDEMPRRSVVCWNLMVEGCFRDKRFWDGLGVFRDGVARGEVWPDQVMVGSVLCGCKGLGRDGISPGRSVHGFIVKNMWRVDEDLGTLLVDFYAKNGFLRSACFVLEKMEGRSVRSWSALICGSAQQGYKIETFTLLRVMQETGVRPNGVTFTGVLSACAKFGLVEEGLKFFDMIKSCGLIPTVEHYGCMVNLFGKVGLLEKAYDVISTMEGGPNTVVWTSYLSACREHGKFEMAERVCEWVLRTVRPDNDDGVYNLLYDIYVLNGRATDAERFKKMIVRQESKKCLPRSSRSRL